MLYKKDEATKGKFAFTTDDYDMYEICFESEGKSTLVGLMAARIAV